MTAVGGVLIGKIRADSAGKVALAALEKQHEAEGRAAAEHRETQSQRRRLLIQQMQRLRLTSQGNGWSRKAWDLARRAAAIKPDPRIQFDAQIQSEAAALLVGQDAIMARSLPLPATAVAFDPSGKRLLISGSNVVSKEPARPVQIWDSTTDQLKPIKLEGEGSFGFHANKAPVFLTVPRNAPSVLQLWDVTKEQMLREIKSPLKGNSRIGGWASLLTGNTSQRRRTDSMKRQSLPARTSSPAGKHPRGRKCSGRKARERPMWLWPRTAASSPLDTRTGASASGRCRVANTSRP